MWKSRFILIGCTVVLTILFRTMGFDFTDTLMLVFIIVMSGYVAISLKRQQSRLNLLMKQCDPQAFLERTIMQEGITGKKGTYKFSFALDKSAAYCYLNRFEEALQILNGIEFEILKFPKQLRSVYYLNKTAALYGLERFEEAETFYEENIVNLSTSSGLVLRSFQYLEAYRKFLHQDYIEAKELFKKLQLTEKLNLRNEYLELSLAQIEARIGNKEDARTSLMNLLNKGYPEEFSVIQDAKKELEELGALT